MHRSDLTVHCPIRFSSYCGFELHEYNHAFDSVTPHTCINCGMSTGYVCWLFPVSVGIIRDKLPQVTEMPLLCVLYCVATPIQRLCLLNHMKIIILSPLSGFKHKRRFKSYLIPRNTDSISRVPILIWLGMASSLTSHDSLNDTPLHVYLEFVSCTITLYKNIPFQTSMRNFEGKLMLCNFVLCTFYHAKEDDSTTENICAFPTSFF